MICMLKIAVIGGRETVMGFKALGLETFPVDTPEEAKSVFHDITREEAQFAIIYVEENLAADLEADMAKVKDLPTPAVILIPGKTGSLGLGAQALQSAIERAVGADIG